MFSYTNLEYIFAYTYLNYIYSNNLKILNGVRFCASVPLRLQALINWEENDSFINKRSMRERFEKEVKITDFQREFCEILNIRNF